MPYIEQKWRAVLDPWLEDLYREIVTAARLKVQDVCGDEPSEAEVLMAAAGMFNYAITCLAVNLVGKPGYAKCALVRAVLADAGDEFYRRVVVPYEREKCRANGDVYPEPEA